MINTCFIADTRAARVVSSVLAALFIVVISGCSIFQTKSKQAAYPPSACRTGNLLDDLGRIGSAIRSIDARARIQLELNGRKQPSISCTLKWYGADRSQLLRLTGYGPFGITLFDCLLKDNTFLLSIPSHKATYFSDLTQGIDAQSRPGSISQNSRAASAAAQFRMALNPWNAAMTSRISEIFCPGFNENPFLDSGSTEPSNASLVCYSSFVNQTRVWSAFDVNTLAPFAMETRDFKAYFNGILSDSGHSLPCVKYPESIILILKKRDITIHISIKKISFNTITPWQAAFDRAPFMGLRLIPLGNLLRQAVGR